MAKIAVTYVGLSDLRGLEAKQVEKDHGIKLSGDLWWKQNQTLVIDAGEEFVQLLRDQGHFRISEVKDDDSMGEVVAEATDPERKAEAIVDKRSKTTRERDASSDKS